MNKQSKIFAIIPVHNRLKFTKKCLESFKNQAYKNFEIIVVDSGSTDNTVSFIKKNYPTYKVIRGNSRWWWTKSVNVGVKEALKDACNNDFILTMNNDCYFEKNYLYNLVLANKQNNEYIIGSLILDAENSNKVIDAGVRIVWEKGLIYGLAKKMSDKLSFYTNRKIIKNLDTLPGKGTLIPIMIIKEVGNFNYIRLPHYLADYEFFCRAKRHGAQLFVSSDARLYNYAKATGFNIPFNKRASLKSNFYLLFGRKSKSNVVDYLNFTLLCCPKKYIKCNISKIIYRIIFSSKIIKIIKTIRQVKHNIPIYIKQNYYIRKIKLFKHNIPIYIKQNIAYKYILLLNEIFAFIIDEPSTKTIYKKLTIFKKITYLFKIIIIKLILKKPFVFIDWTKNKYWQNLEDQAFYNLKRNAVSDAINITNLAKFLLRKNNTCIDIGACIGATSIPMWKKVLPKGIVYSIEADPANILKIRKNLILNNYPDKYVYNYAIYKNKRTVTLNVIKGKNGWGSLGNPKIDKRIINAKYIITQKKVKAITLDEFCKLHNIKTIDFLKIDVEGAEIDVLKGAKSLIHKKLIKCIAFEISPQMLSWHKKKPSDVLKYMSSLKYLLYKINTNGKLTKIRTSDWPESLHGDILAVKNRELIKLL